MAWKEVVPVPSLMFFERVPIMDAVWDFLGSYTFMAIMGVLLVLLIAFLVYRLVFAGKGED
jgi:hypothetical protein